MKPEHNHGTSCRCEVRESEADETNPASSSRVMSFFVSGSTNGIRLSVIELAGESTSPEVVRRVTAQSIAFSGLAHLVICRRDNHHQETHLRQPLFVAIVLESDPQLVYKPALLRGRRYDLALWVDGCCTLGTTRSPSVVVETRPDNHHTT
jgi:hypothetical protein